MSGLALQILLLGDAFGVMWWVGLVVGWVFAFVCGGLGYCCCWIGSLFSVWCWLRIGFATILWFGDWWCVCIPLAGRWFVLTVCDSCAVIWCWDFGLWVWFCGCLL